MSATWSFTVTGQPHLVAAEFRRLGAQPSETRGARRFWTPAELRVLRASYPDTPTRDIAAQLGRPQPAVYRKAALLRLLKSPEYLASPHACQLRRGDGTGAATRFKPGQVPYNKGLRRPGWAPGRMRETQFRRGELAGRALTRWQPIGTEVLDADGYLKRKVTDRRDVPSRVNWRFVHVLVWEQHHGRSVPAGHAVTFANGHRGDFRPENLVLPTRQALMRRNSIHRLPRELAQVIQLRGALQRQINKRARA